MFNCVCNCCSSSYWNWSSLITGASLLTSSTDSMQQRYRLIAVNSISALIGWSPEVLFLRRLTWSSLMLSLFLYLFLRFHHYYIHPQMVREDDIEGIKNNYSPTRLYKWPVSFGSQSALQDFQAGRARRSLDLTCWLRQTVWLLSRKDKWLACG